MAVDTSTDCDDSLSKSETGMPLSTDRKNKCLAIHWSTASLGMRVTFSDAAFWNILARSA
jgi:hypothetical protein